jgi:hypothetical protein
MAEQKLDYIHNNPLYEHCNRATEPEPFYNPSAFDYSYDFIRFDF